MKPSVRFKYFRYRYLQIVALAVALMGGQHLSAATIQKVIVSRQGIKGLAGLRFGSFGAPSINDSGSVAVYATLYGKGVDSTTNSMIALINRTGTARKIVREGENVSSTGGSFYNFLALTQSPIINNSRHTAWSGEFVVYINNSPIDVFVVAMGNPNGTWTEYPPRGATVDGMPELTINKRNACSLKAQLFDDITQQSNDAAFRLTMSATRAIVSAGETPIGLPLGSTYSSFGNPTIDDKNNLYYVADVSDAGDAFDGIWFGKNADPNPLVIKGQSAKMGTGNATFSSFLDSPAPSPNGAICAFTASAGGTNNGVWIVNTKSKEITSVVSTDSFVDGSSEKLTSFRPPAVNNNGQLAFLAASSVTGKTGIYGWNGSKLVKVVAPGDTVNIDGKDKHVIDIRFDPTHSLNSKGVVVFTASFDDRTSGVFTASL
jgi:hypothetical protein